MSQHLLFSTLNFSLYHDLEVSQWGEHPLLFSLLNFSLCHDLCPGTFFREDYFSVGVCLTHPDSLSSMLVPLCNSPLFVSLCFIGDEAHRDQAGEQVWVDKQSELLDVLSV